MTTNWCLKCHFNCPSLGGLPVTLQNILFSALLEIITEICNILLLPTLLVNVHSVTVSPITFLAFHIPFKFNKFCWKGVAMQLVSRFCQKYLYSLGMQFAENLQSDATSIIVIKCHKNLALTLECARSVRSKLFLT